MADIVLSTLNAKYIHASFGLRYLMANLGSLKSRAAILEFDINQRPIDIAEALLASTPKIIGFGVYIWNVAPTTEVVATLKKVRPAVTVILGGPEISYESDSQPIVQLADYVITGEADLKFAEVCQKVLSEARLGAEPITRPVPPHPQGENLPKLVPHSTHEQGQGAPAPAPPLSAKIIPAELPDFSQLVLPYDLYDDQDIAHRVIYVEASRGCPFSCEFCLSSLDIPVRQAPLPALLEHLQRMLDRGAKQLKFVDRTFNLNVNVSRAILEFLLERYQRGHFFHFEMIPDRLPEPLREVIARFPAGALQFEVGIQTFNEDVGALIKRRQNYQRLEENLRFLRTRTGVHVHADLIVGLPGESLESFGAGFDRLNGLRPQEIQVGLLKRLRGTPIVRHDIEWQMVYNPYPPYEVLQTRLIDFAIMQKLKRFARYWDLVGNSGNFIETTPLIWGDLRHFGSSPGESEAPSRTAAQEAAGAMPCPRSPFHSFMRWSEWLHARVGRTDSIALPRLMELLFQFITDQLNLDRQETAERMWRDYRRGGRRDIPDFLKAWLQTEPRPSSAGRPRLGIPKRQARHLV